MSAVGPIRYPVRMHATALLVANTLLLGLRHGFDADHIAAIADIAGSESNCQRSFKLSAMYAAGHAAAVTFLGGLVIFAGNIMPHWLDQIAEKAVGVTLIGLGAWLAFVAFHRRNNNRQFLQR